MSFSLFIRVKGGRVVKVERFLGFDIETLSETLTDGLEFRVNRIQEGAKRIRSKRKRHVNKWLKRNSTITTYKGVSIINMKEE